VPELPLERNSLLTAHPLGLLSYGLVDKAKARAFTQGCIDDFDVRTSGPDAEAGSLSGGNLQKFIVGREIKLAPKLLFVAQPTWGVDIGAASAIRQKLIALRNEGVAILVIFRRARGAVRALRPDPGAACRVAQPVVEQARHAARGHWAAS
jgi:ABC-type uncharacterized transport system ATPase subunit